MSKMQLLEVDFAESEGVLLDWNYKDDDFPHKFYRHFVIVASNCIADANLFLTEFSKKLKPGSLYSILYQTKEKGVEQTRWREQLLTKTKPVPTFDPSDTIITGDLESLTTQVFQQMPNFSDPISICELLDNIETAQRLGELVQKGRVETNCRPMLTLMAPFRVSEISVSHGINSLSTEKHDFEKLMAIFHSHLANAAIEYATLTITCGNGSISSRCQEEWRNVSFNCIERDYYGPSIKYHQDILHFVNTKIDLVGSYQLDFTLRFKQFSGQVYSSHKCLVINFNHTQTYLKSVGMPYKGRMYEGPLKLQLRDNPFKTETVVMFEKNLYAKSSRV